MGDRHISCTFCDDIRQEIANKFSLIGCYGAEMFVNTFPAVLPKLCVQAKIYSPVDRPISQLAIRVNREGQTLAEVTASTEQLLQLTPARHAGTEWQMFNALIVMSPFQIDQPTSLRVEAETEGEVLSCGAFRILQTQDIAQSQGQGSEQV